jgi:O-antigen/teichoic acid export membrane protein
MNEGSLKDVRGRVAAGLLWRFAERCGAQGVSIVVSIILARLLAPGDYGSIALITVITSILNVFVDSGLGSALIQRKDADDIDFSTVFYMNMCFCLAIYAATFFAAPYIAGFYEDMELTAVIRVLSLTIVLSGLKNVQQAYVSKKLMFKRFFYATLGGTLFSAVVGVMMAFYGFGVWALVAQNLVNSFIDTIILWFTVKWRPKRAFSFERLKSLYSYGWKLLVSALINTVYDNIRQLIIGKVYSSSDLAYYNRGRQFPNVIGTNINSSIDSVLLPAMSGEQDNRGHVKAMTRRAIKTSSYIMWPMMLGLAVVAEPLTRLLLTDKWLPSVPYLRIFCIIYAFQPIHTANLNAVKAVGRSDIFLKLEVIKKSLGIIILLSVMGHGVHAIALSGLLYSLIAQVLNSSPNRGLLGYSYREQMEDILPYIGLACVMAGAVYPVSYIGFGDFVTVALQAVLGAAVYIGGSVVLHMDSLYYICGIVKGYIPHGD